MLEWSAFRTQCEIVQMLVMRSRSLAASPAEPASELLVETTSCQHAVPHAESDLTHCKFVLGVNTASGQCQAQTEHARRGRVTPSATSHYDVRLSITEAEHADLRRAQDLLGHAVPSGDPALIYARAMQHYVAHLEKQRLGVKPGAAVSAPSSRSIPKALRRLVWERDGGRCAFVSADGHRCEETGRLELDHIKPVAQGGKSTPNNLRLLCGPHNAHEAERVLGREHVQHRREIARRERARDKVAAQADRERQQARNNAAAAQAGARTRDAAKQDRHDDVYAALRSLGFGTADSRRGAEFTDAIPDDATLEDCVKAALTELTRPLALRGERLARCTA